MEYLILLDMVIDYGASGCSRSQQPITMVRTASSIQGVWDAIENIKHSDYLTKALQGVPLDTSFITIYGMEKDKDADFSAPCRNITVAGFKRYSKGVKE